MRHAALLLTCWATAALAAPQITPPALVDAPQPAWPPGEASRAPIVLRFELTVRIDGTVADVQPLDPPRPPFSAPALAAAQQARFTPALVDGTPTAVRIGYAVHFTPPPAPLAPASAPVSAPPPPAVPASAAPDSAAEGDRLKVVGRRIAAPIAAAAVLDARSAQAVPGTAGDPTLAAQGMPGVARPPAGSGGLSVFGADPAETRILVDGVPVPALYHLGGLRGILPPGLLGVLALTPAAFDPAFGRATGGLLEIETAPPTADASRGTVAVDPLDAAGLVEARLHPRLALAAGGRFGWLDQLLPALAPDAEALVPLSAWRDYAVRLALDSGRARTTLLAFGATDAVTRTGLALEPGIEPAEIHDRRSHRVSLLHAPGGGGRAQLWVGRDVEALTLRFGALDAQARSDAVRGGLRLEQRRGALHLGLDLEASRSTLERRGTVALPRRVGDETVFGQAPGDGIARDRWTHDQIGVAGWSRVDLRLLERLDLSPGLRIEPTVLRGDRRLPVSRGGIATGYDRLSVHVEPRLAASLKIAEPLSLRAALGRHHQAPDPADTSAIFGGTALDGAASWHLLAGAQWRPARVRLEATGFLRLTEGVTVRAAEPTPPIAAALTDRGEARAWGGQLVATLPPWHGWSAALQYTLTWSQRRATPTAPWEAFEGEQRHLIGAQLGLSGARWQLGARLRLASGAPRPRVVGATWDAAHGRFDPLFAGTERLPTIVQLDLRGEYAWPVGPATLTGYVGVLNATNHANVEAIVHRFDYAEQGALTGLPALGILGGRLEW